MDSRWSLPSNVLIEGRNDKQRLLRSRWSLAITGHAIVLLVLLFGGLAHSQGLEQTLGQLNQVMTEAGAVTSSSGGSTFLGFSLWALVGGLIFSGIGFVAFVYGKKNQEYLMMLTGIALMVYPYFVREALWVYIIGAALTAALYFLR